MSQKEQQYWCDKCDLVLVDRDDITTGKFFRQSGHIVNNRKLQDEFVMVEWAVCKDCLNVQVQP